MIRQGAAGAAPTIEAMADAIRERLGGCTPSVAVILGSGLGALADEIAGAASVPFAEIPGWVAPTVRGHAGRILSGTVEGCGVIAFAGRYHLYEGHAPALAALPVRVAHALGARTLFASNAAGGVRRTFRPGDLMLIRDHINLTWRNPLIGPARPGEARFPDMSDPYDPELLAVLRAVALEVRVPVEEGVYAALLGPAYETPAEVRMLERLGADAVGMSTVPEVLVARALGMRVAAVSCITNVAAGHSPAPLSHADVIAVTERAAASFVTLVRAFLRLAAGRPAAG